MSDVRDGGIGRQSHDEWGVCDNAHSDGGNHSNAADFRDASDSWREYLHRPAVDALRRSSRFIVGYRLG